MNIYNDFYKKTVEKSKSLNTEQKDTGWISNIVV